MEKLDNSSGQDLHFHNGARLSHANRIFGSGFAGQVFVLFTGRVP